MNTSQKVTSRNSQKWTKKQLIGLSESMAAAYCPGLNGTKSHNRSDAWTTENLIGLSKSLENLGL